MTTETTEKLFVDAEYFGDVAKQICEMYDNSGE
jgi:hypothetical protein